jgi:hypothetical protein
MGERRKIAVCHRRVAVAEEVEELLSRQRKKRLRESLAFRSLEPCSSCVLEVLEGVLGVHGVLACAADLFLLQQRSRGESGWKR